MMGREQAERFAEHGMPWRVIALVWLATQLVACGSVLDALPGGGGSGSGSESSSLSPELASGTLSGVAKDGLIRNATVNVYAWDGAKGELLGSGRTDGRGRYSLQLTARSQSILLEVTGGDYQEEVTLRTISLNDGEALYALRNYPSGQSLTTSITYYTTLATGLAENLVRLGMQPPDAVEEANTRLGRIIGVDTSSVKPTDILDPDSVSVPELDYGFATAALSSLTERASILNNAEPHRIFTSVRFIQAAYDDVRADGVLNGRGMNGDVVFGRIRLTSQVYRHELALHILRIANDMTANRTGRGPREMFELARRLNDSTDPIFGDDPVIPIDNDKPNVSALAAREFPNLPNGAVVFGGLNLSAMVVAFPGAATAELLLDDQVIGAAADPESPSIALNTFNPRIEEGRHTLKLRVTDISGAIGESPPLEVIVSNQQTVIENISIDGQFVGQETLVTANIMDPAIPRKVEYSVRPQGATTFVPVIAIMGNNEATMLQAAATINPRQAQFADGNATFKVEVTNSVGAVSSREVPFVIDKESPLVTLEADVGAASPRGRYFDEELGTPCVPVQPTKETDSCVFYARLPLDVRSQVTDNGAIERVAFTVDGSGVGQPLVPPGIVPSASSTLTIDPRNLGPLMSRPDKIVTVMAVDKANNTAMASQKIVFDTTAPTAVNFQITKVAGNEGSIVLDGDPVVVKGPVNISAQVEDEFGVASAQILLNGVGISAPIVNQDVLVTTTPFQLDTSQNAPNGVNVISVIAMDRAGNQMVSASSRAFVVDNAAPVITLTGLSFERERCQLEGSVGDARFDSLVFTTDRGFQSMVVSGGVGDDFVIRLGNDSGAFTLEAKDALGNVIVREFNVIKTDPRTQSVFGTTVTVELGTCELRENGESLFRIDER